MAKKNKDPLAKWTGSQIDKANLDSVLDTYFPPRSTVSEPAPTTEQLQDQSDQQRSTSEIEKSTIEIERSETRSKKRSKRSTKIAKFSTGPADSAGVGEVSPADSAGVGEVSPADSAGVGEVSPADSAGVGEVSPADSAGVQKKGFLAIPNNLLERMFLEIKLHSAFKVYLYLYQKAFKRVHDDRVKASCNIELADITKNCNMADRVVRDALNALAESGWVSKENRPGLPSNYVINRPSPAKTTNGDHDLLNKDHVLKKEDHLKKEFFDDDSLSIIKKVYFELTKNTWTNKDTETYKTIASNLKTEDIIRYMNAIFERTKKPIGSFAYFVKAIEREHQSPKNKKSTVSKLRKIVESVKEANIGGKPVGSTDFIERVKEIAAQEGIPYIPDLLEEALKPKS